ncbi:MAG: CDP-6-deoxy-delta-3,4-glucoseen reductase [Betaproteobacteria bacterium]|jgi:CDP-4-dehydro-6-deoxyglucose reductase
MTHTVTIKPSNQSFELQEDECLLDGALREGLHMAYGCRNGACGSCKARVLSGDIEHGVHQESTLSTAEKAQGFALFCQTKALSDVVIECREISALKDIVVRLMPCRVQTLTRLAPDVMHITLRLPSSERLAFLAGQYIDIISKVAPRRSLSIASPPHQEGLLELHLRNYGGPFSQFVFNTLKEKDILRFEGPLGTFFLREDTQKPILFLASGTGFAPIKAIIEHALHQKIPRAMSLYWGGRIKEDLYLHELATEWAQHHGIHFVPVLSALPPDDPWTGRRGLVHEAVMVDHPLLADYEVYACGAPIMVESARRDFINHCQLPEESFFSDAFTPGAP